MFQSISDANFGSITIQLFPPLSLQFTCFQCQNIYLKIKNIFTKNLSILHSILCQIYILYLLKLGPSSVNPGPLLLSAPPILPFVGHGDYNGPFSSLC